MTNLFYWKLDKLDNWEEAYLVMLPENKFVVISLRKDGFNEYTEIYDADSHGVALSSIPRIVLNGNKINEFILETMKLFKFKEDDTIVENNVDTKVTAETKTVRKINSVKKKQQLPEGN